MFKLLYNTIKFILKVISLPIALISLAVCITLAFANSCGDFEEFKKDAYKYIVVAKEFVLN